MAIRTEVTVRATTSNAISFQMLSGTTPLNITSYGTVELYLKNKSGGTAGFSNVGSSPKLTVTSAANGSVDFTPGTADLVAGSAPYQGYFKLYASTSSWLFVPEDSEFTVNVRETF